MLFVFNVKKRRVGIAIAGIAMQLLLRKRGGFLNIYMENPFFLSADEILRRGELKSEERVGKE